MSGILGTNFSGAHWRTTTDRSDAIARARSARDRLSHRGADFAGDWYDDRFFLGHAEQGGLDSGVVGRLPLFASDASSNAAVTVTLDGHISNAQELRQELGKRHAFHGNGGSEIVAQAYLQWGLAGMLDRLRGSFALAIYDRVNARICLARDALGTRPLYYLHEELASGEVGSLIFASELKAVTSLADESLLTVDYTALYDYLTYRYIPAPKTLYSQVRKLAAGHSASFDLNTGYSSAQSFWELPDPDAASYGSEAEFVERAQELLAKAVAGRLPISSGLVGDKLSQTPNSATPNVAALCQRSGAFAHWLSLHHPGIRPQMLNAEENSAPMSDAELKALDLRGLFDEPFADVSFAARHQMLDAMAGTTKCAISDLGAEVVFGTAPRYRHAGGEAPGTLGWFKSKLGSNANSASTGAVDAFDNYTRALGGLQPSQKSRQKAAWDIPDDYNDYWYFQQFYRADLPRTLRFQRLDLHTLIPEHQLTQLDRQAARHGIEARTPLLDQDLLTWLLCAPSEMRGPQLDMHTAMLAGSEASAPILERLKQSLKEAASFLPVGKGVNSQHSPQTWDLLKLRFPEFDAT